MSTIKGFEDAVARWFKTTLGLHWRQTRSLTSSSHAHRQGPCRSRRGRALLEAAESWAREQGLGWLTLNVFAGNTRAQRVYERLGYEPETLRYVKFL